MHFQLAIDLYRGSFELIWSAFESEGDRSLGGVRRPGGRFIQLQELRGQMRLESTRIPLRNHHKFEILRHVPIPRGQSFERLPHSMPLRARFGHESVSLYFVRSEPCERPYWIRERIGNIELLLREKATDPTSRFWWRRSTTFRPNEETHVFVELGGLKITHPSITGGLPLTLDVGLEDVK